MRGELDEVLRIARTAAARVREVYATPFTVELKGPDDPVTRADREANEILCAALARSFPGDAILAEESAPTDAGEIARITSAPRTWFVDPVDGTREFADRNGEFAVMVGLAEQGRAVLGVLVVPVSGEAFAGGRDVPAFVENELGARTPLAVSRVRSPRDAAMLVSRSHRPALLEPLLRRLAIARLVPCGSVGVKVARLARGEVDLYVHGGAGVKLWDTCGPEAVLTAAGGRFTDLSGAAIDYASPTLPLPNGLVATNGLLHDALIDALAAG